MGIEDEVVMLSGEVFKTTSSSDLVVGRKLELLQVGKFQTVNTSDKDRKTIYLLCKECTLRPANSADIVMKKRHLRKTA
eukprot:gene12289-15444_t